MEHPRTKSPFSIAGRVLFIDHFPKAKWVSYQAGHYDEFMENHHAINGKIMEHPRTKSPFSIAQWIGLRENLNLKP